MILTLSVNVVNITDYETVVSEWFTLLIPIWYVILGLNQGPEKGYDRCFSCFSSIAPDECLNSTLNKAILFQYFF